MGSPGTFHPDLCGDAGPLARTAPDDAEFCDLCAAHMDAAALNAAAYEVCGFHVCTSCIEATL